MPWSENIHKILQKYFPMAHCLETRIEALIDIVCAYMDIRSLSVMVTFSVLFVCLRLLGSYCDKLIGFGSIEEHVVIVRPFF